MREGGWTRTNEKPPQGERPIGGSNITGRLEGHRPAAFDETIAEIVNSAVDQAVNDIIADHRRILRTLRELYEERLAEYRAMLPLLSSFRDEEYIENLRAKGDVTELNKNLMQAFKAQGAANTMLQQLVSIGGAIIRDERAVWDLNTDAEREPESWDDLVALVREPSKVRALPDHVLNFERRMGAQRGRPKPPGERLPG